MKKIMYSKKSLIKIKYTALILIIIAAGFYSFEKSRSLGTILVLLIIVLEWRLFRCPHCNNSLNPRTNLDKNSYCSHCGEKID